MWLKHGGFFDDALPKLKWPTDYRPAAITQHYGVPTSYGTHEGVDIRTGMTGKILSSTSGTVAVADAATYPAYGNCVVVKHSSLMLFYAHLSSIAVKVGDMVQTGSTLGIAGMTGSSTAVHLHLGVKYDGKWLNPEPLLVWPESEPPTGTGTTLRGLHLSNRAGEDVTQGRADAECVRVSSMDAVKITTETPHRVFDTLDVDASFCVVRLFTAELASRIVPPAEFCDWFIRPIRDYMTRGVLLFEVHNEPNLAVEWCGTAAQFADWYGQVLDILHRECPGAQIGFPGLSPQPNVDAWLLTCADEILSSDWVGVHCYWRDPALMNHSEHGGYWKRYVDLFPQQRFIITEFSNNDPAVSKAMKGAQYVEYWNQLPLEIEAAFCFISSSDNPAFAGEAWADESGKLSDIPYIIGETEPPTLPPLPVVTYNRPQSMGGVHISFGGRNGYGDFLRNCGRSIFIKSVMDFGALMEARQANPDTVTVIRVWPEGVDEDTPPGNWQWPLADSARIAREWMANCYKVLDRNGREWFDYVEIINEPDPADAPAMERASAFMQECMEDADRHGYKLAIWAWAAGLPRTPRLQAGEFAQMEASLSTLKYAAEHGHALAVHEGSVSDERRLIRQAAEDKCALRYRITAQLMTERGWPMPPVVITEAYQESGYRAPNWDDWKWYWSELAKDPYVLGAGWFTLGDWSFGGDENVNIVGQLPGLARAIAAMPEVE